jgi:uncharacterized membrane protein
MDELRTRERIRAMYAEPDPSAVRPSDVAGSLVASAVVLIAGPPTAVVVAVLGIMSAALLAVVVVALVGWLCAVGWWSFVVGLWRAVRREVDATIGPERS